MDHSQAVEQMAAERYLLDELTPELREDFEEHFFDCEECALDVRAGATFVAGAKTQLPELLSPRPASSWPTAAKPSPKKPKWFFWWQPAFAVPAFALLLGVIAYQNLATIPSLRSAADEPRILPWVSMHTGTRGAAHIPVTADAKQGAVVIFDTPQNPAYTSYAFELYDPKGRKFWSQSVSASDQSASGDGTLSLFVPGSRLQHGSYSLAIYGVTSQGERTKIEQRILDIHFDEKK
jgi:hypothetical protein